MDNRNAEPDRENLLEITLSVFLFISLLDRLSIHFIITIDKSSLLSKYKMLINMHIYFRLSLLCYKLVELTVWMWSDTKQLGVVDRGRAQENEGVVLSNVGVVFVAQILVDPC